MGATDGMLQHIQPSMGCHTNASDPVTYWLSATCGPPLTPPKAAGDIARKPDGGSRVGIALGYLRSAKRSRQRHSLLSQQGCGI